MYSIKKLGLLFALVSIFFISYNDHHVLAVPPTQVSAKDSNPPDDNRFTKTILSDDLNEPMELAVAPDGRVFFTERTGNFYVYLPKENKTKLLYHFPVKAIDKYLNGLIGITLDPDFTTNRFIYFFYCSSTAEQFHQNVSRFVITPRGELDTTSEKVIIEIPIDLEVSAHTGGSLAWDKNKNLYISTGDNTVPFESDGYAPIDRRPGRHVYDAERSAGNTNDLRGKILRIHPEKDGSYTIPPDNLFPKGTPFTRPEIYVMGCRNPYRIGVDTASSILYWGEVGPDAGKDSRHGPRGYDEFNQARSAGNFGWPYFVGNNKAYHDSDFATKAIGDLFEVAGPENNSPNNTGAKILPAPQLPLIWYPYNNSEEFPMLENGGRCAMGGPVYHYRESLNSQVKLPKWYDGALFVYDWMRNWVFTVRMDENHHYKSMEPFMRSNGDFRRPIDLETGPDGALYMLEYGSVYGIDNIDARLVKITYNGGNRAPIARITASDSVGTAPAKVHLSATGSYDNDHDSLRYQWVVNGKPLSTDTAFGYNFDKNGVYKVSLKVSDPSGADGADTIEIVIGNTPPEVAITTPDNSSFFFGYPTRLRYDVRIKDKEDRNIDNAGINVSLHYIPKLGVTEKEMAHQALNENYNLGKMLMASSDCKACHQLNSVSVGPSFMRVAAKYPDNQHTVDYLVNKIITGGGGVWGEHAMSAHPQLSKEKVSEIVKYILSLDKPQKDVRLAKKDTILLKQHVGKGEEGRYILTAAYTDRGNGVRKLSGRQMLILRSATVKAVNADSVHNLKTSGEMVKGGNGSYFMLKHIDLKNIHFLRCRLASSVGGVLEVHAGSLQGKVIGSIEYDAAAEDSKLAERKGSITDPGGKSDLYFVFNGGGTSNKDKFIADWVRFER